MSDHSIELSIIIPVKDEAESIVILAQEIENGIKSLQMSWECIWVDDGSSDDTAEKLARLHQSDHRHQFIQHSANYGQSAALFTGFKFARGNIIATLDGDLQNDPSDIPKLIEKMQADGVDMVNGVRAERHDSFVRKASSKIANGFRNWLTNDSVTDVGCSLRVFYKKCTRDLPLWKGMHRFFPTLVKMKGYTVSEMPVTHRGRKYGETKYGIQNRLWVGLADTFGVRWLQGRGVYPEVNESSLKKDQ